MNDSHHQLKLPTGVTLHTVEREGNGSPVLLVHGIWDDWRYFEPLVADGQSPFGERPVIRLDLRGHGESSKPDSGYGLGEYAQDIQALIELRGAQKFILAGHSLGALVSLRVASMIPDQVEALLLEDPPLPPRREAASSFIGLLELKQLPLEKIIEEFQLWRPRESPEQIRASAKRLQNTADGVLREAADGGLAESVVPGETLIEAPALTITSSDPEQRALGEEGIEFLHAILPQLQLKEIPDTSHSVLRDAPERYRALVTNWLESR